MVVVDPAVSAALVWMICVRKSLEPVAVSVPASDPPIPTLAEPGTDVGIAWVVAEFGVVVGVAAVGAAYEAVRALVKCVAAPPSEPVRQTFRF